MGKLFNIELDNKIRITFLGIKISLKRSGKYRIEHLLCELFYKFCKTDENKIIFINVCNFQYSCNIKYIANEILRRNYNLDLVFVYNDKTQKNYISKDFRLVSYTSIGLLYELITAKAWICNSQMLLPTKKGLKKKAETIYFQTFHGSMGIKKIEADCIPLYEKLGWTEWQKIHTKMYDYLFTDSQMEYDIFTTAFWGNGEIKKLGKARDTIFYQDPVPVTKKIKEYYNIPDENKICLYAPTWRANGRTYCYNIDIKLLKKILKQRFGGDWTVLIRAHCHTKTYKLLFNLNEITDVSKYPDMQELLVASDILISDYSSCIPEYTILKKPSFIYASDINEYDNNDNGFYYPLSVLPSPIAENNGELMENILNFDEELFKQRAEEFLIKMGHKDDENSCKRIVDFILEKMK